MTTVNFDQNQLNEPKKRLGFELWEIFTAFTMALTVASGLMWFSNLQPQQIKSEFIEVGKDKSKIYNHWLQIDKAYSQPPKNLTLLPNLDSLKNSCYTEIKVLETNQEALLDWNLRLEKPKVAIQDFIQNNEAYYYLNLKPDILSLAKEVDNYANFAIDQKDSLAESAESLLLVKRNVANICNNFDLINSYDGSIVRNFVNGIRKKDLLITEEQEKTLKILEEWQQYAATKKVTRDKILEYAEQIISIDPIVFLDSATKSDISENFFAKLEQLEEWEFQYASQNNHSNSIIYITKDYKDF